MSPSAGVVAILFTDLVGSTALLDRVGDDVAEAVRRTHFSHLREAVSACRGEEVKNLGDGLMVAFPSPVDAVACAVAMQRAVERHNQAEPAHGLRLRVGLQVGDPPRDGEDFFGTAVVVAKRLCDAAQGGQILASELVVGLVGTRGGFRFRPVGRLSLKGLAQAVPAVAVEWQETTGGPEQSAGSVPAVGLGARRTGSAAGLPVPRGPALTGRDRELSTLERELERAAQGELRCVLLVGEAGLGKTRLAAELVARHPEVTTLSARAHHLSGTASFGLWVEALERHLRSLDGDEVGRLCGGFLDDLASVLRSVAALRGAAPDHEPPRARLLEGLAVMVGNLAARSPLVVLLDDVHLADASSWQALDYLAWNLSGTLVLATARPELAQDEVAAQVLFRLEEDGILRRLALDALDRSGVAGLAAGILEREPEPILVDWLAQRSQGNPLFAAGLLRALLEEGADLSAPRLQRLPESLTERVSSRIRALDEGARSVLELLAVLGRKVDLADLVALSNRSLENIAPVLDRLVAGRFLTEEELGRDIAYEITHPLIAETIYSGVGAARRRALHRSAGRTLRDTGRLSDASLHYARSADVGDSEAIEALLEGMRQAEDREAFREALAIISALVDLIPTGDGRWLEVAGAMSWKAEWVVEHKAGLDAAKGIRALQEIDALLAGPAGDADPGRRAAVKSRLAAFCAWVTGELKEAERYATEAVGLFEAAGDRSGALVATLELAYVRGLRGDYSTLESEAGRVLQDAQRAGLDFVVLQALGALGFGAFFHGNFAAGAGAMSRALELARAQGKEYFLAWSLSELGFNLGFQGRMDEALPLVKEAKSASRHWRDTPIPDWEIAVHLLAGDLALALERAEEAVAWNAGGMSRRRGIGMAFAALAAAEAARLDDAYRYLALGTAAYQDADWSFYGDYCGYAEAVLAWREGRPSEAVSAMRRLAARLLALEARPFAALLLVDLAEVAAACGDAGTAEDAVIRLEKVADEVAVPFYRGLAALGTGWWGLVGGPPGAASAQEAVDVFSGLGCRLYLGRALDVLGRLLAPADPAAARRALDSAVTIFEECGAHWRQERGAEALDGLEGL